MANSRCCVRSPTRPRNCELNSRETVPRANLKILLPVEEEDVLYNERHALLPSPSSISTIVDVGGNEGCSSLDLTHHWPRRTQPRGMCTTGMKGIRSSERAGRWLRRAKVRFSFDLFPLNISSIILYVAVSSIPCEINPQHHLLRLLPRARLILHILRESLTQWIYVI